MFSVGIMYSMRDVICDANACAVKRRYGWRKRKWLL